MIPIQPVSVTRNTVKASTQYSVVPVRELENVTKGLRGFEKRLLCNWKVHLRIKSVLGVRSAEKKTLNIEFIGEINHENTKLMKNTEKYNYLLKITL
jgi:hypothetical protein